MAKTNTIRYLGCEEMQRRGIRMKQMREIDNSMPSYFSSGNVPADCIDYVRYVMRRAKERLERLDAVEVDQAERDWAMELSTAYTTLHYWLIDEPYASPDRIIAMQVINWIKTAVHLYGEEVLVGIW